jgi:tRNA (guanine-N7-)-methyltransferase
MGQKKLHRFAALLTYPNVLQYPEDIKGNWHRHFDNGNKVTLELACGKGEYSIGLGTMYPDRNFVGVDIKGNRIFVGAKRALETGMTNVAFLRCQIASLDAYFADGEVSEIWILFPDPFLRDGKAKNRLTHPRFLRLYQSILPPAAKIHLKTDSKELYDFTLDTIQETNCAIQANIVDVHGQGLAVGELGIRTHYEQLHLDEGRTIYYLQFTLPSEPIPVAERLLKPHVAYQPGN